MRTLTTRATRATLVFTGIVIFSGVVFMRAGGAAVAARPQNPAYPSPPQQPFPPPSYPPPYYPGQSTQAHVWVENRGPKEAIPVDLSESNLDRPLPVTLVAGDSPVGASSAVPVRPARTIWEYRTLLLKSADDPTAPLAALGGDGWEVTGLALPRAEGTLVLLKRPR